jgi:DNA-binding MarR family transcriptional regulator
MKAWRAWILTSGRLANVLDRELQSAHDLGLGEYEVLVVLSDADGGRMRMAALAEATSISRSLLSHRFSRLLQRGFVAREQCPDDGRGAFANVTKDGLAALKEAAPTHVAGVRQWFLNPIPNNAVEGLGDTLERIATNLAAADKGGCADPTDSVHDK